MDRQLDELQVRLKKNKVPEDIQEKIQVYMQFCHQEGVAFNQDTSAFAYMSRGLKQQFMYQEYDSMLESMPMFKGLSKVEIFEICSKFKQFDFIQDLDLYSWRDDILQRRTMP